MKILLFISFLTLLFVQGCMETNTNKPEKIVNLDNSGYIHSGAVDKPAEILPMKENKSVFDDLKEKIKSEKLGEELYDSFSSKEYFFRLLGNESGTVDRIFIINGMGERLNDLITGEMLGWQFRPAELSGKSVKSIYDWKYSSSDYYLAVDKTPEIIGGIYALQEKIIYPELAKRAGIEGKVFVRTFIDESGNVVKSEVIKGIGAGCDEAAVRAINGLKFTPGMIDGKAVRVEIVIPISFKLQ